MRPLPHFSSTSCRWSPSPQELRPAIRTSTTTATPLRVRESRFTIVAAYSLVGFDLARNVDRIPSQVGGPPDAASVIVKIEPIILRTEDVVAGPGVVQVDEVYMLSIDTRVAIPVDILFHTCVRVLERD